MLQKELEGKLLDTSKKLSDLKRDLETELTMRTELKIKFDLVLQKETSFYKKSKTFRVLKVQLVLLLSVKPTFIIVHIRTVIQVVLNLMFLRTILVLISTIKGMSLDHPITLQRLKAFGSINLNLFYLIHLLVLTIFLAL